MHMAIIALSKAAVGLALFLSMTAVDVVLPASDAQAQMSREPFQFRVHRNPTALNTAVIMRQVENGGLNGNSSSANTSAPIVTGSNPMAGITQYNSTTIGNMSEINTILESGAEGYINLDTSQDGAGSSQSAASEGTQVFGGNTALGSGNANAGSVTSNNAPSSGGDDGAGSEGGQ